VHLADAPKAAAAMAVEILAEGAGALLGPEADFEDNCLANPFSDSLRT